MLKFWMLYVEGGSAPARKHENEQDARTEAERLAKTIGKIVVLLEAKAICACLEPPVQWGDF